MTSAREQAVETMARAITRWLYPFDVQGEDRSEEAASAALDALLDARSEEPCGECGGTKRLGAQGDQE